MDTQISGQLCLWHCLSLCQSRENVFMAEQPLLTSWWRLSDGKSRARCRSSSDVADRLNCTHPLISRSEKVNSFQAGINNYLWVEIKTKGSWWTIERITYSPISIQARLLAKKLQRKYKWILAYNIWIHCRQKLFHQIYSAILLRAI